MAHLQVTDQRLFQEPFTAGRAAQLEADIDLAERVDAFLTRFGCLQDTLRSKLLPAYLSAFGKPVATFLENLDHAERLGLVPDAEVWLTMRQLRNPMAHDYLRDAAVLATSLQAAHEFVPVLIETAAQFCQRIKTQSSIF
ncbi:hypothetical protein [Thermosynechococcus sichuanensis]|uniref:hypothetical protein n=1 Tax=Thermosynechococcus sichuanensis TaxID=3161974 RepID=UPI001C6712AD|nr:hypothetical protein [Thermosynechococcus vestitus]